jgi:hypothetical protein
MYSIYFSKKVKNNVVPHGGRVNQYEKGLSCGQPVHMKKNSKWNTTEAWE